MLRLMVFKDLSDSHRGFSGGLEFDLTLSVSVLYSMELFAVLYNVLFIGNSQESNNCH